MPNETEQERQNQSLFDLGSSFPLLESVISKYKVSRLFSKSKLHPGQSRAFPSTLIPPKYMVKLLNCENISQTFMPSLVQINGVKFCSVSVVFLIRSFLICISSSNFCRSLFENPQNATYSLPSPTKYHLALLVVDILLGLPPYQTVQNFT